LGARGMVAQHGPICQTRLSMRSLAPSRNLGLRTPDGPVSAALRAEPALNVTVVYQDALTLQWSTELWERVEPVIGSGRICRQAWGLGGLAEVIAFENAVQAAAAADVLVISVCAAGDLPLILRVWIDAWMPERAGRAGALVALIGLPSRPDASCSPTHQYFRAVARQAGLDFLPRERKLPEGPPDLPLLPSVSPEVNPAALWPAAGSGTGIEARG